MPSELLQVADAVVAALKGAELSQEFEAQRLYRPEFELPEMATLHVTVVPKGIEVKPEARGKATYEYKVDVGVQKRFEKGDATELDPLMQLVEEIAGLFRLSRLAAFPQAVWVKTEHAPVFAPEHMEGLRQFTSILTFTFRVVR